MKTEFNFPEDADQAMLLFNNTVMDTVTEGTLCQSWTYPGVTIRVENDEENSSLTVKLTNGMLDGHWAHILGQYRADLRARDGAVVCDESSLHSIFHPQFFFEAATLFKKYTS